MLSEQYRETWRWASVALASGVLAALVLMLFAVTQQQPEVDGRTATAWIGLLRDPHSEERVRAIDALPKLAHLSPRAVPSIAAVMNDSARDVRLTAATALGLLGPLARTSAPELRRALNDPDSAVRAVAGRALGGLVPTNSIGPLARRSIFRP